VILPGDALASATNSETFLAGKPDLVTRTKPAPTVMACLQHRSTKGAAANDGRADTIEHRRYRRVRHVNCHARRGYSLMRIQDRFSDSLGGAPQRGWRRSSETRLQMMETSRNF
jgi:hypothetical protein